MKIRMTFLAVFFLVLLFSCANSPVSETPDSSDVVTQAPNPSATPDSAPASPDSDPSPAEFEVPFSENYDAEIHRGQCDFGMVLPFGELSPLYSQEEALSDGCLVLVYGHAENINMLVTFSESFGRSDGSFLRVWNQVEDSEPVLIDFFYQNSSLWQTVDSSRNADETNIVTFVYDNCVLSLRDGADGLKELVVTSNENGAELVLLDCFEEVSP